MPALSPETSGRRSPGVTKGRIDGLGEEDLPGSCEFARRDEHVDLGGERVGTVDGPGHGRGNALGAQPPDDETAGDRAHDRRQMDERIP